MLFVNNCCVQTIVYMTNSQKWGPGCPSPIETGVSIVSFNVF